MVYPYSARRLIYETTSTDAADDKMVAPVIIS